MHRGRPIKSEIRQNIIDILYYLKSGYGYEIFKIYRSLFPKCTNEVIYYHLKKGVILNEFVVDRVEQEKGKFSWGPVSEKIYYKNGPEAKPRMNKKTKEFIEKLKKTN